MRYGDMSDRHQQMAAYSGSHEERVNHARMDELARGRADDEAEEQDDEECSSMITEEEEEPQEFGDQLYLE